MAQKTKSAARSKIAKPKKLTSVQKESETSVRQGSQTSFPIIGIGASAG